MGFFSTLKRKTNVKKILIALLITVCYCSDAQTIKIEDYETIWTTRFAQIKLEDHRNNNTSYAFILKFLNKEYAEIRDWGYITFDDLESLKLFANTCKKMIYSNSKDLSASGEGYRLRRYKFEPRVIHFYETQSGLDRYNYYSKPGINRLCEVIEKLE